MATETRHRVYKLDIHRQTTNAQRRRIAFFCLPVIAEKAKEQQIRKSVSQKSVEQKPIDTQKELAKLAGVSHDTIHKVEKMPEICKP